MDVGSGSGAPHFCETRQSLCWRQITRDGAVHWAGLTQDVPASPATADSSEQHTVPFEQSSGPSQVIATEQPDLHIPVLFIIIVAGQQGPVASVQDLPSQATVCLLYTSPSPRDGLLARMPSCAL